MNDFLVGFGAVCVVLGSYLILPALALVVLGLMLMAVGLVRLKGVTDVTNQ